MSGLEPAAAAAALGATEAAGAGMAATAWADAVAAGLAAGLTPAAVAPIAATAAGSSVPGVALPVAQAAGTHGLSGAMGQLAPVYTAGMNTAGLAGPGGSGTVMGNVLPGMNQDANLLTTPFAKAIDTMGPGLR